MTKSVFNEKEKIYRDIFIPEQADQSLGYVARKVSFVSGQWVYRPSIIDVGKIILINKTVNVSFRVSLDLSSARVGSIIHILRGSQNTTSISFASADASTILYIQNTNDNTINDIWGLAELIKVQQNSWLVHGNLN